MLEETEVLFSHILTGKQKTKKRLLVSSDGEGLWVAPRGVSHSVETDS